MPARLPMQSIPRNPRPGGPPLPADEPGSGQDSLWHERLASLAETGHLNDPSSGAAQAWDALGTQVGSWVDPIVRVPAPVKDLPELGDRYQDLAWVGEGATARVYKALDTLLQRQVALKVLKGDPGPALAEARAQAKVEHPNVCRVYEVGRGHIVLQLVEGPTLAQLAPGLSLPAKVRLLRDVAFGVHAAHLQGLVHLDLKLNNVLMQRGNQEDWTPLVSDFGMVMAHPRQPGPCPVGTPPYTSPEQLAGDRGAIDARTDVYALGVMLYVLLCGTPPFPAQDLPSLLAAMADRPPVPPRTVIPALPRDLEQVVLRCMEKAPNRRYSTAQALAEELDRFLRSEPLACMGVAPAYRLARFLNRNRKLAWLAAGALAILLASSSALAYKLLFLRRQMDWNHHFQGLVEELQSRLSHAHRLPRHPIEPELMNLEAQILALKETLPRMDRAAHGPGELAIGQALLLLDPGSIEALDHFQRAWDLGFRTGAARAWLLLTRANDLEMAHGRAIGNPRSASAQADMAQAQAALQATTPDDGESRPGPYQARAKHILRMAELQCRERVDHDALIQESRAYRARFPEDVAALLDLSRQLVWKASWTWRMNRAASRTWPPPGVDETAPLMAEAGQLLDEARRIAPSHPEVYAERVQYILARDRHPLGTTPPTPRLAEEIEATLAEGRAVAPNDPGLIWAYTEFAGTLGLERRLIRNQAPEPVAQALLALLDQGRARSDGWTMGLALNGLFSYARTCARHGLPASRVLLEAIRRVQSPPPFRTGGDSLIYHQKQLAVDLGMFLLASGQDPTPALAWIAQDPDPAIIRLPRLATASLVEARFALAQGRDPGPSLERLEGALASLHPLPPGLRGLAFEGQALRAAARNQPDAWRALRAELEAQAPSLVQDPDADLGPLLKAQLAVARHLPETSLKAARATLRAIQDRQTMATTLIHERSAECHLLESRSLADPGPALHAALREARLALAYPKGPADPKRWFRPPANLPAPPPHQGTTWALRGEACLALAEARPGSRRTWAGQALQAFRRALDHDANLALRLAPLQNRARTWARGTGAGPVEEGHAHP